MSDGHLCEAEAPTEAAAENEPVTPSVRNIVALLTWSVRIALYFFLHAHSLLRRRTRECVCQLTAATSLRKHSGHELNHFKDKKKKISEIRISFSFVSM